MPRNTGGRRPSARRISLSAPGGGAASNHKPLFDMNVMSLNAKKNVAAAAVTAAEVTRTTNTLFLNANGTSAYIINVRDSIISSENPTLYLRKGQTYIFENKSGGHPFRISESDGGDAYETGVTNNDASGPNGVLTFTVPANAPDTLYYYCTSHANAMKGTINIIA